MQSLLIRIQPDGDGWNARQFNQLKVNMDVHEMKAAMAELQDMMTILIDRINGCKNCN